MLGADEPYVLRAPHMSHVFPHLVTRASRVYANTPAPLLGTTEGHKKVTSFFEMRFVSPSLLFQCHVKALAHYFGTCLIISPRSIVLR